MARKKKHSVGKAGKKLVAGIGARASRRVSVRGYTRRYPR
jgi:hypothetical protein